MGLELGVKRNIKKIGMKAKSDGCTVVVVKPKKVGAILM
jgi:hypothetical protein